MTEVFKPEFQLYELCHRLQILEGTMSQDYGPALTYFRENMELLSGSSPDALAVPAAPWPFQDR